jgi:hypothetical protein
MPKFEAELPEPGLPEELDVPTSYNLPAPDRMPPVPLPVDDFPGGFGRPNSSSLGAARAPRNPGELPLE